MPSSAFDEKTDTFDSEPDRSEDTHQGGAHEGGRLEDGAQERNMASGSARYLRYILFAIFVWLRMGIGLLSTQALTYTGSFDIILHLLILLADSQFAQSTGTGNEMVG
jgi:hypothetical protein